MSEHTIALIAVAVTTLGSVVLQVMAKLEAARASKMVREDAVKARRAADVAASEAQKAVVKAQEVKVTLAENTAVAKGRLDALAKVAESTHTLVNSNMSVQLKISAVALRRIAELTKDPGDVK